VAKENLITVNNSLQNGKAIFRDNEASNVALNGFNAVVLAVAAAAASSSAMI
jgi:hypothetical protein